MAIVLQPQAFQQAREGTECQPVDNRNYEVLFSCQQSPSKHVLQPRVVADLTKVDRCSGEITVTSRAAGEPRDQEAIYQQGGHLRKEGDMVLPTEGIKQPFEQQKK